MKPHREREERRDARAELLRQLATWKTEDGLANKYQLEKKVKTRRETLYNLIDEFKKRQLIHIDKRVPTKTGNISEQYTITDKGLYCAAMLNPDLEESIASRLGDRFKVMSENVARSQVESLEFWTKMAGRILESGKAPPKSRTGIEISANEHGRIRTEIWIKPWGDLPKSIGPSLSDDEVEKMLAAGGGKMDSRNLTPQQKELLRSFVSRSPNRGNSP